VVLATFAARLPSLSLSTLLFGPRISRRHNSPITPFGQVLFGVAHVAGDHGLAFSTSNNSFAMAIDGGVDFKVSQRFSIRPVQMDYLMTHFNWAQARKSKTICASPVASFSTSNHF
jgi:hypothetical protein